MRVDEVRRPLEVLGLDVGGREGQLHSAGFHGSDVSEFLYLTAHTLGVDDTDEVVVVTCVPVKTEIDAVVDETCFKTEVQLFLLLVGQIRICEV